MNFLSATVELPSYRFIPLRNTGSIPRAGTTAIFPQEIVLYKYNRITSLFTDSVRILGDTIQTDSILTPSPIVSCYENGRIYFLASKTFLGGPVAEEHLIYTVVDTNLNVVIPQRRIISSKLPTLFRQLFDLRFHNDRLYLSYTHTYQNGAFSISRILARILEIEPSGQVRKDTVAGIMPDTLSKANQYSQYATQILKDADQPTDFFVAGIGLSGNQDGFGMSERILTFA